jgi:hypothetical protein
MRDREREGRARGMVFRTSQIRRRSCDCRPSEDQRARRRNAPNASWRDDRTPMQQQRYRPTPTLRISCQELQ